MPKHEKTRKPSVKRCLTDQEITNILDKITGPMSLPKLLRNSVRNKHISYAEKALKKLKVYPDTIPCLSSLIEKEYHHSLIEPGDAVGILAATAMGQKNTQLSLDSFHHAGLGELSITQGVPRLKELLSASKNPKNSFCKVFFKDTNSTITELRDMIGSSIVHFTLKNLTDSVIILKDPGEIWYEPFSRIYNIQIPQGTCLSFTLKKELLYRHKITLESIAKIINKEFDDVTIIWSPLYKGRIDFFMDTTDITLPEDRILYVTNKNKNEIFLDEVAKPILEKIQICGITGISNRVYYIKDGKNWRIDTEGTNFIELLNHPMVDTVRTRTNHLWEVYNTLGIEALYTFLLEELADIMSGINLCHIKLLLSWMLFSGGVNSVSRYGIKKVNVGPLAKATFEESQDNLLMAGFYGTEDTIDGVSASIICAKMPQVGTGVVELMMDIDKLMELISHPPPEELEDENIDDICIEEDIDLDISALF
jgi:DNA-directed RNA polymerase beta' subunit